MSIIPDPGAPPDVAPTTTPLALLTGTHTIAAGTEIYSIDLWELYFVEADGVELVNNGTVWMDSEPVPTDGSHEIGYRVLLNNQAYFDDVSIVNTGLIYLGGQGNVDLGGGARYTRTSLVNTGSIFAVSANFQARVITSDQSLYVENSGLIAARTIDDDSVSLGAGQAIAIEAGTGHERNQIINHAGGQILAEAPNLAIAISVHGVDAAPDTPIVTNAGLIEAAATDAGGASFGIYVLNYSGTPSTIVNSGTIRAQFAIWGTVALSAVTDPVEHVVNQAGGEIFGAVVLNLGDDVFQNDGTVTGPVQMGFDDDHFFGSGKVNGWVDMGWGIDLFEGSGNSDRAAGGRDDDVLHGNGGRDLLFGGFGDDTLRGDGGNDGLIGEWGDDTIHTEGGDYVEGGDDQDRIVLGDYTFEKADGGDGFDVLVMADGARDFSLAKMVLGGRVTGFEAIKLKADQQLSVAASAIGAFSGGGTTLWVDAAASNTVHLAGTWVRGADIDHEGAAYEVWTQGSYTVFVSEASTVTPGSNPGYGGFNAVAAGTAALRPGAGLDYTDPVFLMTGVEIHAPGGGHFTVHPEEILYSPSSGSILYSYDVEIFTNNGQIYAISETGFARGPMNYNAEFINNNLIYVELSGDPYYADFAVPSIGAAGGFRLTNRGDILVHSEHGPAIGVVESGRAINSGLVSVISDTRQAIGLEDVTGEFGPVPPGQRQFLNTGVIYAEGNGPDIVSFGTPSNLDELVYYDASAVGVRAAGSLTNDGLIVATLGANADADDFSIGIFTYHGAPLTTIVNNGEIEGTYAIVFGRDSTAANHVENNGLITGDILFFHGDDSYDGSGGEMHGTVFAFGGDDTLLGGASDETFDGGDGDDLINGGGGVDTASYFAAEWGVTVDLSLVTAQATGQGSDTLTKIENLTGSNFADTLSGNGFANLLDGGLGDDTLLGGAGSDILHGGAGRDEMTGGLGNDTLFGGAGDDVLLGGAGADVFVYTARSDSTAQARDWLKDFVHGTDLVDVRAITTFGFTFEPVNPGTAGAWTRVTIATSDGPMELKIDGFADLSDFLYVLAVPPGLDLVGTSGDDTLQGDGGHDTLDGRGGDDALSGLGGDDLLIGRGGSDTLDGGAGSDVLDGGAGQDQMIGGLGDDTYVVDNASDTVVEGSGEGLDGVQTALAGYTLGANVEHLAYTGADAFTGTGNALANRLAGGDGDDVLAGRGGADVLAGGTGNDTLDGGAGYDTADYSSASAGVQVRLARTAAQDTGGAGIDTLANIERVTGSAHDDRLTGDAQANRLDGGAGNDVLDGGAGADAMIGGAGDDLYYVDDIGDTVSELAGEGVDRIQAWLDYTLGDNVENLTLKGALAQSGTGNDLSNVLRGTVGDNTLNGLGGNDELYGRDGDDTLLGGSGSDRLEGEAGRDAIDGGGGDDLIVGGTQKDTLIGGGGADTFFFDDGEVGSGASSADIVLDFDQAEGDKVHVRQIDANTGAGGDQNFSFIGTGAFTGVAGQLHYLQAGGNTFVEGDTDGDGTADFVIRLDGLHTLAAGDFVL